MLPKISFTLALALALPLTTAEAQERRKGATAPKSVQGTALPKSWQQEPDAILGIKIGVPLDESMPACAVDQYGYAKSGGPMCWAKNRYLQNHYEVNNVPTPGIHIWDIHVETVGGTVEYVHFYFNHYDRQNMADLLSSRFGAPMHQEVDTVQNRMGATFDRTEMRWEGSKISLLYQSRADKVDRGIVVMNSRRWMDSKKFDVEKNKGKL